MAADLITLAVAIGRVARGLTATPRRAEALVMQWIAGGELDHAQLDPIYTQGLRAVPKGGRIGVYDPGAGSPDCVAWVDPDDLERLMNSSRSNAAKPLAPRPSETAPTLQELIAVGILQQHLPPGPQRPAVARKILQLHWSDACRARQLPKPLPVPDWKTVKRYLGKSKP